MFHIYKKLSKSKKFLFKNVSFDDEPILQIHYECVSIQKIITCVTKSKVPIWDQFGPIDLVLGYHEVGEEFSYSLPVYLLTLETKKKSIFFSHKEL